MSSEASSSIGFSLEGIGDVEDYSLVNEAQHILPVEAFPLEKYSQLFVLLEKGNRAFRENRLEEAINCYSTANSIKPSDPVILNNRSVAYVRFSQFLKQRSASASEYCPLNSLDMTTIAELALKDAEKLMNLRNTIKSYIIKAGALILLERYETARDVVLSGLQIDPFSAPLQSNLQDLDKALAFLKAKTHGKAERSDDFDCTLCLKLMYEPVTTPCGHSFCRSCLFQSMDRGNKCPLCRTVLFITPRTCAISVSLNNIIQKNFPDEYAERKLEQKNLTRFCNDVLPLFVMDVAIPCQKMQLHIFEPRYRLMVRRIMEGNHRMGMVALDSSTGTLADFACELEITECDPLADGRFVLELEGCRRCHILKVWDQDGYRVAEVEWLQDAPLRGEQEKAELQELTSSTAAYALSWLERAKEAARRDRRRLERLHQAESMMPSTQDPERFSFWLNTLTDRRPFERLEFLRLRDTKERIRRGMMYLNSEEQGCRMQ